MTRASLFLAGTVGLFLTTGAQAQVAGTYSGTSVDGGSISLTVTGTTGNFTLSNMNVNFQAHCTHPSRTANEGWGFFLGQAVVSGDNNFHSSNDYYDIRGSLQFISSHKVKGAITSVTAVFVPGDNPPVAAQFCKSAKQGFMLLLQTAPIRNQHGTATVLEKRLTQ